VKKLHQAIPKIFVKKLNQFRIRHLNSKGCVLPLIACHSYAACSLTFAHYNHYNFYRCRFLKLVVFAEVVTINQALLQRLIPQCMRTRPPSPRVSRLIVETNQDGTLIQKMMIQSWDALP
jgi:hypothetical protein